MKFRTSIAFSICFAPLYFMNTSCGSKSEYVGSGDPSKIGRSFQGASGDAFARRQLAIDAVNKIYQLQRPIVGIAQVKQNEVPFVQPMTVHHEDVIFQIARCPAHYSVQGIFARYDSSDDQLKSHEDAIKYFIRNKFWNDISGHCNIVSLAQPQATFIDSTSPTGDWRLYLRACLSDTSAQSLTCSEAISSSEAIFGYRNQFSFQQQEILERISNKMQIISQLASSFPQRSLALAQAMDNCDLASWNQAKRMLARSLIANVIGYGSSIIFAIFEPSNKLGADLPRTWSEKIKQIWEPSVDQKNISRAVTRSLLWLFTSEHDFKETCFNAEEIRINASADLLKLKSLQTSLSLDLDEANRLGIPLPAGISQ